MSPISQRRQTSSSNASTARQPAARRSRVQNEAAGAASGQAQISAIGTNAENPISLASAASVANANAAIKAPRRPLSA